MPFWGMDLADQQSRLRRSTVRITLRSATLLFVLAIFAIAPAVAAQEQTPPSKAPAQEQASAESITGDLVKVDAEAKTLTIKPATGGELEFKYDDKTEVTGAKEGAAGLATMKEGRVTVHFKEDAQTKARTATKIEILPRQQ
jgi:Cu/Ag efflux protein CusF